MYGQQPFRSHQSIFVHNNNVNNVNNTNNINNISSINNISTNNINSININNINNINNNNQALMISTPIGSIYNVSNNTNIDIYQIQYIPIRQRVVHQHQATSSFSIYQHSVPHSVNQTHPNTTSAEQYYEASKLNEAQKTALSSIPPYSAKPDDDRKYFYCDLCDKKFVHESNLKCHHKVHGLLQFTY